MQPPGQPRAIRRLARSLVWPLRRFFDPRFKGLGEQIDVSHEDVAQRLDVTRADVKAILELVATLAATVERNQLESQIAFRETERMLLTSITELRRFVEADIEANSELATIVGRSLADLLGEADRLRERLDALEPEAARLHRG
jgi:hypothetical protein